MKNLFRHNCRIARSTHTKGEPFGSALIAASSVNYTGAVIHAGEAAYRSGAGLVQLAIPASIHAAVAGDIPEATWILLPHATGVIASDARKFLQKIWIAPQRY